VRAGALIVLALGLGAWLASYLLAENGYVLASFHGYAIEMSVPVAVFCLCIFYIAVRLIAWLWRAPRRLGEATARLRMRFSARQATRGYLALAEGDLARGERLLTRHARQSGAPLLNYLAAARLAHMQNDRARRDGWLALALEHEPATADAVLLTQADMLMSDCALESAQPVLERILEHNPKHGPALRLFGELLWRRQDWDRLSASLPTLRVSPQISADELLRWTRDSTCALLARPNVGLTDIERLWNDLPRAQRVDPVLLRARVRALIGAGESAAAEAEIRRSLREVWDPELVLIYAELPVGDLPQQLKNAESFLRDHPEDADLLLAVGRLSLRNQLWGKARSYLETSIAVRPTAETFEVLGQLMQRIGDKEAATRAFQRGLALQAKSVLPPSPVLKSA
jgi:HemY protein